MEEIATQPISNPNFAMIIMMIMIMIRSIDDYFSDDTNHLH